MAPHPPNTSPTMASVFSTEPSESATLNPASSIAGAGGEPAFLISVFAEEKERECRGRGGSENKGGGRGVVESGGRKGTGREGEGYMDGGGAETIGGRGE